MIHARVLVSFFYQLLNYPRKVLVEQMRRDMTEELQSLSITEWEWIKKTFPDHKKQIEIVVNNGYNARNLSFTEIRSWKKIFQALTEAEEQHLLPT